jgi:hypothetical protein
MANGPERAARRKGSDHLAEGVEREADVPRIGFDPSGVEFDLPGVGYTAIGHTVGLAQRMEQLAELGKAYLTRATHSGSCISS